MVKTVSGGHIWELLRLSCLRRNILGIYQEAGGSAAAAGLQLRIAHTLAAARGFRRGDVARGNTSAQGRAKGPTAQRINERGERREERENFARLVRRRALKKAS